MSEKTIHSLPPALAEVALVDASTAASVGGMGVSWWHDQVRLGKAPAPAIRKPRCTRWRLADVKSFWAELLARQASDEEQQASDRMVEHCRAASRQNRRRLVHPAGPQSTRAAAA